MDGGGSGIHDGTSTYGGQRHAKAELAENPPPLPPCLREGNLWPNFACGAGGAPTQVRVMTASAVWQTPDS